MDITLDDHPDSFVLPPVVAVEFNAAGFVFLNAYSSLAATYNAHGDMLFNLTPQIPHVDSRMFASGLMLERPYLNLPFNNIAL